MPLSDGKLWHPYSSGPSSAIIHDSCLKGAATSERQGAIPLS